MSRKAVVILPKTPFSMITRSLDGLGTETDPDVVCGRCDTVLVHRLPAGVTLDVRVVCFGCGAMNDLNQAAVN